MHVKLQRLSNILRSCQRPSWPIFCERTPDV